MTQTERAESILAQYSALPMVDRLRYLAVRLAVLLGVGHTVYTILDEYGGKIDNDPDDVARDLALRIAGGEG